MVYTNPVPDEFATGQYYDAEAAYYLSPAKLESDYAPVRFERELRFFRRYCAGGSILDVGCSSGAFLYHLKRLSPAAYKILGTDVSGPPLDYAESKGVPVVRDQFLAHDFGSQRFDAITFWAVLEHLAEPKAFLEKAAPLLKPRGLCFVLVPNFGSLASRLLRARYRYIYPQHLNYFKSRNIRRLLGSRFKLLELRTMHFNPVVIWQDWRSGGKLVSNEQRAALLQRTTAAKQNPTLWPLRVCYKLAERVLSTCGLADNLAVVLRAM